MGSTHSVNKINCMDLQKIINTNININDNNINDTIDHLINSNTSFIIINTLNANNQECLIKNTLSITNETNLLNKLLESNKLNNINIIIYGENSSDNNVITKYNQLYKLGFHKLYVYVGGLFEWLLLQDIYGDEEFSTTSKIIEILKYKGKTIF